MSEARTEIRLDHLEERLRHIEETVVRIEATLNTTLPHLATKAELADKPGKTYLATAIGVLLVAYTLGLAGLPHYPLSQG
jgi:hypothetical protein